MPKMRYGDQVRQLLSAACLTACLHAWMLAVGASGRPCDPPPLLLLCLQVVPEYKPPAEQVSNHGIWKLAYVLRAVQPPV